MFGAPHLYDRTVTQVTAAPSTERVEHLQQVGDAREELRIDGQAAVERVPGAGDEAHGELVLEHDDGRAEGGSVREQLEGERRRDLVRDVGHADVEVGQLLLHHVPLDDLHGHNRPPSPHQAPAHDS